MLRFLQRFLSLPSAGCCWSESLTLQPLFCKDFLYLCAALWNSLSSREIWEVLFLIIRGRCFLIAGGWLDRILIYRGLLLGFLKGENFLVFKLRTTSRKSVCTRLVSAMTFRLCGWKIFSTYWLNWLTSAVIKTNINWNILNLFRKHVLFLQFFYYGYRTHTLYFGTYLCLPSRSLNCFFTVTSFAYFFFAIAHLTWHYSILPEFNSQC